VGNIADRGAAGLITGTPKEELRGIASTYSGGYCTTRPACAFWATEAAAAAHKRRPVV